MTFRDRDRVDLQSLARAYRHGMECDSVYMTAVAGFVGGKPLCRPYTTARSLSSPVAGLRHWLADWAKLMAAALTVMAVALANAGKARSRPPAAGIYVYQQERLRRLLEFLGPEIVPVQFTMNVLRFAGKPSASVMFTNRIAASRVPVLAFQAVALQVWFWIGFLRRPDWRLLAYGVPCWGRAVEFLCLREVVRSAGPGSPVWSTAIIDRTISWLSELRRLDGFFLGSIQHGSYEGVSMPHRLQVDRLMCYPWSEGFYRKHFGEPLEVVPEPGLLRLQTKFVNLPAAQPGAAVIAVISQPCLTSRTVAMLDLLAGRWKRSQSSSPPPAGFEDKGLRLIIYAHPSEDPRVFGEVLARHPGLVELSPKARHSDIDLAVAQYSTLALEYARMGVPTVVYPPGTFTADFFELAGIEVVRNDQALLDAFGRATARPPAASASVSAPDVLTPPYRDAVR